MALVSEEVAVREFYKRSSRLRHVHPGLAELFTSEARGCSLKMGTSRAQREKQGCPEWVLRESGTHLPDSTAGACQT